MQKIRFILTLDDLFAAYVAFVSSKLNGKRYLCVFGYAFFIEAVIFFNEAARAFTRNFVVTFCVVLLVVSITALLAMLLMFEYELFYMKKYGRRVMRHSRTSTMEISLRWDSEAITIVDAFGLTILPWELFKAWLDSPSVLLLYQRQDIIRVIPKRVLSLGASENIIAHLKAVGSLERKRFGFV